MDSPDRGVSSRLERVLRAGQFAVTAEVSPPDSADPQAVYDRVRPLAHVTDAVNVTDGSGANVHMGSLAACALLVQAGIEPVMQLTCRDRNRIALQGDLLGAAGLGIRNVLCLTGDGVQAGDHPQAKPVFDLDGLQLLQLVRVMHHEGRFMSGRRIESPPSFFAGAAANPFAPPYRFRVTRLAQKWAAGAQFIQTQFCYDLDRFRTFMHEVREEGLDGRLFILAGVGPLRSAKAAQWMREKIPGVVIPDELIARLRSRPLPEQRAEGVTICLEMIEAVREIKGVSGIHIMAFRQEEAVAELVERAGLRSGGRRGELEGQPDSLDVGRV